MSPTEITQLAFPPSEGGVGLCQFSGPLSNPLLESVVSLTQLLGGLLAFGDVADDAGEERLIPSVPRGQRELQGELAAIALQATTGQDGASQLRFAQSNCSS